MRGCETTDAGVGLAVIMLVDPIGVCCGALFIAEARVSIDSFLGQSAVESFDLAVSFVVGRV